MSQAYLDYTVKQQAINGALNSFAIEATDKAFSTVDAEDAVDPVFMGFEWESCTDRGRLPEVVKRSATSPLKDFVNWRSGGNPLELVSIPATLNFHKGYMEEEFFKKGFGDIINESSVSPSSGCGVHVHIDKRAFTPASLKKFISFVALPSNRSFVEYIAGRSLSGENNNCVANRVNFTFARNPKVGGTVPVKSDIQLDSNLYHINNKGIDGKGSAVNTTHKYVTTIGKLGTVEFRMFNSVHTKELLFKNLEFTDALVRFTRRITYNKLTYQNFIRFVEANKEAYPYLTDFIIYRPL